VITWLRLSRHEETRKTAEILRREDPIGYHRYPVVT